MYESNNYYGTLISKLTKRVNNVPYKDSEKADVLIANLHSTDVDNMYKTLQVNKHESMGIKRKTKELNKQQKSNVGMFLLSTDDLKASIKLEYSQIIKDFLEYSPLSKLEDYFGYLKLKSGFSADTNSNDFFIKETLIKQANILQRYLFSVHQKYPPRLKIEYFKRPNSRNLNYPMKINKINLNFMKLK